MHIDNYNDTINACRFCFMCRHLSAVGNVTFRESDTPRGRALLTGKMLQEMKNFHPDYVDTFYEPNSPPPTAFTVSVTMMKPVW